jgi:hypothetical protein
MAKNHYIDNKLFFTEMVNYKKAVRKAKRLKEAKPKLPEYVGKCFMMIAENLSHKPNFLSYTFRDEMISDAIENCVMYADNFDPTKSKNPFAYFTQIVYYAFLRRIKREKQHLYIKYKSTEIVGVLDEYDQLESDDGHNRQFEMYDNIAEFIENFEKSQKINAKKKKINLEKFIEE